MSSGCLFDTSPQEGEGQSKKRGRRRVQPAQPAFASQDDLVADDRVGFLLSLGSVPCPQCGAPADLDEVLIVDGRKRWRVMCGWWCMTRWTIDPIPGLLGETTTRKFVIREGRFAGKTFDEAEPWYVEQLAVLSKNEKVKAAAKAWLASKNLLDH